MVKKLLLLLILSSVAILMLAQTTTTSVSSNSSSAYSYEGDYAGVERLKMKVYILGRVNKPGLYLVPDNTEFLTLLALAGGPSEDAKLSKIRIIRTHQDQNDQTEDSRIIWINLKKYMETADKKYLLTDESKLASEDTQSEEAFWLKPGDTVVVSGTIFYAFSKVADFLSKAAIALSVYNLVTNLGN